MIKRLLFIVFFISGSLGFVFSQVSLPNPIILETSSPSPLEDSNFIVSVKSFRYDLDRSNIYWYINNRLISSGFGQKEISLGSFETRQTFIIKVEVKTLAGETYTEQKTIVPQKVVLLYEGVDSYTPYWYVGKPEPSRGSSVRVYAHAEIFNLDKRVPSSELFYKWYVRGNYVSSQSGLGKNVLNYRILDEYGESLDVAVEVSKLEDSESVTKNITINTKNPQVLINLGDENGAVVNFYSNIKQKVKNRNFSLIAEPLYFSTDYNKTKNLEYFWSNSSNQNSPIKFFEINSSSTGETRVNLEIDHKTRIFQNAKSGIVLSF